MATEFNFNGRRISIPGSYSETKSGVNNPTLSFPYGEVLVIEKDANNVFGGGAGVVGGIIENGINISGEKTLQTFDNIRDFQSFVKGGPLYDLAQPLFRPFGAGINGISRLHYMRAFTTVASTLTVTWTGGGANGGVLKFNSRHEGLCGNGVEGNETRAKQICTVTNAGATGDTINIVANAVTLGLYTQVASPLTINQAAAALAAAINANTYSGTAHGYSATVIGAQITVSAPANLGTTANGYTFVKNVTGTATATVGAGTMAGGVDGDLLTRGLSMTMHAGVIDTAKFIVKFWRGTFTGNDSEGHPYGGTLEADTAPVLLAKSIEFDNAQEVIDWAKGNAGFNNHIQLDPSSLVNGTGAVTSADLAATTGNRLFTGGTQTYNTARVDDILDAVRALGYTFTLSLDAGSSAQSADNGKILSHIVDEARFQKYMIVAGGDNIDTFVSQSIAAATFYANARTIVVHGGVQVNSKLTGTGVKAKSALWKAAAVVGRIAGLSPQTPATFKGLGYQSELHPLSESEKEQAIKAGVLVTGYDGDLGINAIVAAINTLQSPNNDFLVNADGTSHLISIERIAAQLNKEIEINAKVQLLGNQEVGPNQATISPEVVKAWVAGFLEKRTSKPTSDNLILAYQDITVAIIQDAYHITYGIKPNFEVNKLFFTTLILDPAS